MTDLHAGGMSPVEIDNVFLAAHRKNDPATWEWAARHLPRIADDLRGLLAAYEDRSKAFERAAADCVRLEGVVEAARDICMASHQVTFHEASRFGVSLRNLNEALAALSPAEPPEAEIVGMIREAEDEQHAHAEHLREAREVEQHQEEKHGE